jgi:hypothetical protein
MAIKPRAITELIKRAPTMLMGRGRTQTIRCPTGSGYRHIMPAGRRSRHDQRYPMTQLRLLAWRNLL